EERGPGEQEWLIADVNSAYIASTILPEVLARHLGSGFRSAYDVEVFSKTDPKVGIYPSENAQRFDHADASVNLFEVPPVGFRGPPSLPGGGPAGRGPGSPGGPGIIVNRPAGPGFAPLNPFGGMGRWELSVRLHAGSLEAVVSRARMRNLAISAMVLF